MCQFFRRPLRVILSLLTLGLLLSIVAVPTSAAAKMPPAMPPALESAEMTFQPDSVGGGARPVLDLSVAAPSTPQDMGAEITAVVSVSNPSATTLDNARLYLPYHPGIIYTDVDNSAADVPTGGTLDLGQLAPESTQVVNIGMRIRSIPRQGPIHLQFRAQAVDARPATAHTILHINRPPVEQGNIPAAGQHLQVAAGQVGFDFPPGWHDRDAHLTFQVNEQQQLLEEENGTLLEFDVEVRAQGSLVTAFAKPITVTIQTGDS